jgi:Transposase DDE domain
MNHCVVSPERQSKELKAVLQSSFNLHGARLEFMAIFILALLSKTTCCLARIAEILNPRVDRQSNEQRIRRFLDFDLPQMLIAQFVLASLPPGRKVISIDRTEHFFGKKAVNMLVLAVCWKGMAIPLFWINLDKRGCSNTDERITIIRTLLKKLTQLEIGCVVADREFASRRWLRYLKRSRINFVLRCKRDALLEYKGKKQYSGNYFEHTGLRVPVFLKNAKVYGSRVNVLGMQENVKGDKFIVLSNLELSGEEMLRYYKMRWEIETLFGALKTRGFNFESAQITDPTRVERLLGLLTIAAVWVRKVGEEMGKRIPIKMKEFKDRPARPEHSLWSYGLSYMQPILQFGYSKYLQWDTILKLL